MCVCVCWHLGSCLLQLFQKEMKAIHEAEPNTMILRASKVKLKKKKMKRYTEEL